VKFVIEDPGPGLRVSTKFIERTGKLPAQERLSEKSQPVV
jgi:hypothetical protein